MKNFEDFRKFVFEDSETSITKKLSEKLLELYDDGISKELTSIDAMNAAITSSLVLFSINMLEQYHEWLYREEN